MTRSKEDIALLIELGYDPNDPSYTVENFGAPVTATVQQKEPLRMNENIEKRVRQYVERRDVIRAMEKLHEEELAPHKAVLEKLAGVIHKFLDDNNVEMVRTDAGTCYISTKWSATVRDAAAFMQFVIEQRQFDLLERRASSTAVKAYVEEHNSLPTGVDFNALSSVGVRRPAGKAKS